MIKQKNSCGLTDIWSPENPKLNKFEIVNPNSEIQTNPKSKFRNPK